MKTKNSDTDKARAAHRAAVVALEGAQAEIVRARAAGSEYWARCAAKEAEIAQLRRHDEMRVTERALCVALHADELAAGEPDANAGDNERLVDDLHVLARAAQSADIGGINLRVRLRVDHYRVANERRTAAREGAGEPRPVVIDPVNAWRVLLYCARCEVAEVAPTVRDVLYAGECFSQPPREVRTVDDALRYFLSPLPPGTSAELIAKLERQLFELHEGELRERERKAKEVEEARAAQARWEAGRKADAARAERAAADRAAELQAEKDKVTAWQRKVAAFAEAERSKRAGAG
jgi:hypothetical protein